MTVLVSDSFNRSNSTSTLGTTDSYNGGTAQTWQFDSTVGSWGISNNQAYTPVSGTTKTWVQTGASDISVQADIKWNSNDGIIIRFSDVNNYITARIGSSNIGLYKMITEQATAIGTAYSFTPTAGTTYTLKITASGSNFTVYLNGTSIITGSDTYNQTATQAGIRANNDTTARFDNFIVSDLSTGSSVNITGVVANATASSLPPTVAAQQQVAVLGVVANTNANTLAPSISTSSSVSVSITSVVANANANALSPVINTSRNTTVTSMVASATGSTPSPAISTSGNITVTGAVASSTATALVPQVGSFTNVSINAVVSTASASAVSPSVEADKSVNLGVPVSNAVGSLLVPNVGSSVSVQIASAIASLVVNGIAPSISTTKGININPNTASASLSTVSPTIQRDMVLFANVGTLQAAAITPTIFIVGAPNIHKTVNLSGSRKLHEMANGSRKLHENANGSRILHEQLEGGV